MTMCLAVAGLLAGGANTSSAQVTQMLHDPPSPPSLRTSYNGTVGCKFQVGSTNVVVSHVGVYDPSAGAGLNASYQAGVMDTSYNLLGGVVVPAGASAYLTNSYWWMPLDPPLLLQANTSYYLASVVGPNDQWPDAYTPASWNAWFVGSTASSTRHAEYGPGYAAGLTPAWPPPYMSDNGNNDTYGNVMLGYIEVGQARAGVAQTSVTIPQGQTLNVGGFASGQRPITYQWYELGVGAVAKQTNVTLVIPNVPTSASGTYYLTATNALGGEQSANVTVSVTSFPVGITQQPTNATVFANYPVTFSLVATGTPSIYYQWLRNTTLIPGATQASYSLTASQTNNNDVYSCVASNYLSSGPHTATSSNATLTVVANLALPQQILHGYKTGIGPNTYGGQQGGQIVVGSNPVLVTHLGYYAWPANTTTNGANITCTLVGDHHVGLYTGNGANLLGYVDVPAGSNPVLNGYMWQPLDPPLVLSTNTQYLLVAETISGQGDWGDTYAISDLNHYMAASCDAIYGGSAWGQTPYLGGGYSGQMYSAPNMALLAPAVPTAWVYPSIVTQYATLTATFNAGVAGQPPVTVQWYKEPGTRLTGQTNLTLNLNSLSPSDGGNYYVIATNTVTGTSSQSADASLTVLPDVGPTLTQDIQSEDIFVGQTLPLTIAASGTPTFSYQWTFDGAPIAGATGATFSLNGFSAANVGNYQCMVTNNWGQAPSSIAHIGIIIPAWGTYSSGIMADKPLLYYRFGGVIGNTNYDDGVTGIATNQGTLGYACNGLYEETYSGGITGMVGPTNLDFEPDNQALSLDGYSADVLVPPLNVTLTNATIAAWVYQADYQQGSQKDAAAIYCDRADDPFLLNAATAGGTQFPMLAYAWNNNRWQFVSGLTLPSNQWTFVAMVITPTNGTLYMQDGTTMWHTNDPAAFNPITVSGNGYVGWDSAGGAIGRRWYGGIDEVMVFNTAMSPTAINALYLGVPSSATLTIAPSAPGHITLTWPGGTLLESTTIAGPWAPVSGVTNSPATVTEGPSMKFYRVRLQ
jgi:hypothetical protein